MSLNLADPFFWIWIAFTQEVQRIIGVVHWTKIEASYFISFLKDLSVLRQGQE
jgi:hypothetical protein